jgi:hypothetical protein
VRYSRLRNPDQDRQVSNTEGPLHKRIKYARTCGVGERFKCLDDYRKQVIGWDRSPGFRHGSWFDGSNRRGYGIVAEFVI